MHVAGVNCIHESDQATPSSVTSSRRRLRQDKRGVNVMSREEEEGQLGVGRLCLLKVGKTRLFRRGHGAGGRWEASAVGLTSQKIRLGCCN